MPLWRRLLPIQVPALLSSSRLWPASPLPPSASMATGYSIPIPVIADGNRSARSSTVARPASVIARPSGSTKPPTPTPSRAPPTPSASARGAPAIPAPGSVPASLGAPARRPLQRKETLKSLSIKHLNQNPAPLPYKIPAPHRYKIPPFPIPLSSGGLSPSTLALRCNRTSCPTSTSPRPCVRADEAKRVNVDFPQWMLARLDLEADRLGVPRQSLIKVWIAERLALTRRIKPARQ